MMEELAGRRVALVTGAGRGEGIGVEVCRQLADHGVAVLLTARRGDAAEQLAARLRAERPTRDVHGFALDVTNDEEIARLAERVEDEPGRLDILVNNAAGVAPFGEKGATADLALATAVMNATLFGAWRMCERFLPLLRRSGAGRIVNVSSGAGSHGDPVFGLTTGNGMGTSYAVAKAALNALTVKLALEERDAGTGVLVNAVCPGFTATFPGGEAMGARPVPDGAAGIVWGALLSQDGPTAGFFRDGKPLPW